MPWKVKEFGEFEVDGAGNPIFVLDSGEEKSVDYPAMASALTKANREAAERKEKLRANEEVLKKIKGIEDLPAFLEKAKKDAEAVAAFDDKQKSAEESARARVEAAVGPLNQKIKELETSYADALARYHRTLIDAEFGTSKYVNSELVSPVMAKDLFGRHFSVNEQGAIVATDTDGNIVYNEKGPADFDSALRTLVASSPYKDYVLKGNPASGSGAKTGNAGSHTDWSKLTPAERLAKAREAGYK